MPGRGKTLSPLSSNCEPLCAQAGTHGPKDTARPTCLFSWLAKNEIIITKYYQCFDGRDEQCKNRVWFGSVFFTLSLRKLLNPLIVSVHPAGHIFKGVICCRLGSCIPTEFVATRGGFVDQMCSVHSAFTGEVLVVLNEFEGRTAREVKQSVAAQIGISRFRQRLFSEERDAIHDDELMTCEHVKLQLTLLEWWPPEIDEDQKLISASRDNDLRRVEELLQYPRNPNVKDAEGKTPLHHSAENGHVEPMRLLLEAGATKNESDSTTGGKTPLLLAIGRGDAAALLLQVGADPDLATLEDECTPLYLAAGLGYVEVVCLLLDAGARVDKAATDGVTPLIIAAQEGHAQVVLMLIQARADIDRTTNTEVSTGATPLHSAATWGQLEVVRVLLSRGADINRATTDSGTTPLYCAAGQDHRAIVRLLLGARAEVDKAAFDVEMTPLHVAAGFGYLEVVYLLLAAGANIDSTTTDGAKTPLFVAAEQGHFEVVFMLIEEKADIDRACDTGVTPLSVAVANGKSEVAALLRSAAAIRSVRRICVSQWQ